MKFVQYKEKGGSGQHLGVLSDDENEIKELTGFGNDLKKLIENNVTIDDIKSKLGSASRSQMLSFYRRSLSLKKYFASV